MEDGLVLAMDLCVAYQVYQSAPQVWTLILQRLTSLRLWDRLRQALAVMDGHPELWSIPAYVKGKTQFAKQSIQVQSLNAKLHFVTF